jgi:hypothetical protein
LHAPAGQIPEVEVVSVRHQDPIVGIEDDRERAEGESVVGAHLAEMVA